MEHHLWDCFQKRIDASLKRGEVGLVSSVVASSIQKVGGSRSVSSDAEMIDFLDALLKEALHSFCPAFDRVPGPIGPQHKWRYSSGFQKAVRRNDGSIKAVAAALNACDPAYIWRRAPTIALEDVGLGDPWVVALVLHACRFARVRKTHGHDLLAGFLGELMGSALKDRLSCDSFCLPYLHPELAPIREAVDQMANPERAELYRSDETPFALRVAAGIALAGPRYGGDVFSGTGGSPEAMAEAGQGLVPYPIQWISRQYARMAKDGMFVALPLVWRQLISEGQTQVVRSQLPERRLIDGVLSATFDGYTSEGRRALSYLSKACAPVQRLLADTPNRAKVISLAVFTVDSSLLDRYLSSPWAAELYRENLRGEVLAAGISFGRFEEVMEAVAQNRDQLHHARMRVTR